MTVSQQMSNLDCPQADKRHDEDADSSSKEVFRGDTDEPVFNEARTARLLRKIDVNILPIVALLYLLSFLDRTNIGNARLVGLEKDLNLKGLDFNVALAVFFPWYMAADIPSNIMMKRTCPSLWLCVIMVAWGICMTAMGFVKNYTGLLIVRMALGFAEGGLTPGVNWYITLWYRRHECGLRMALFFSATTLAGAFGGLLARGISEMHGIGGRPGWAWIFIIEGLLTIFVAVFAKFFISDSPETARFLTEEERCEVRARLTNDHTGLDDNFRAKYVFAAFLDWKIYVQMIIIFCISVPVYSISLFLPTIVKDMGYANNQSQLMSVPPYVLACIMTITAGVLADRSKTRGPYMMLLCAIGLLGFLILINTRKPIAQYIATFLAAGGLFPTVPMSIAWNGNNIGGATKRAIGIAMQVGFANLAGVVAAFTFRPKDAPRYLSGYGLHIGMVLTTFIFSLFMHVYLKRENARRDDIMTLEGLTLDSYMKYAEREKGDDATFFRFTV